MRVDRERAAGGSAALDEGIVGRDEELERIGAFLAAPVGGPRALVIQGEPGIGKTTLWRYGVAVLAAVDVRVLRAAPAAAERSLPLSTLTDLLEPAYDLVRLDLHPPQRRALDVALARAEPSAGNASDPRLLQAATLGCLRALSLLGRVAVAIDDCQWVDAESAAALSYALRRLEAEPVLGLFSLRPGDESGFDPARQRSGALERIDVGPLSLGATQRLLLDELGVTYPRAVIRRVVETSGGNPFYALELARSLQRGEGSTDEPAVFAQTLDSLVGARLAVVSGAARSLLGPLSLLPSATIRLLDVLDALAGLDEAVAAGLVDVEGETVRFSHPLLAAGMRARLGPEERRRLHAALASALEDPVEQARHLARSTIVSSAETAAALARAATAAASRALPSVAAQLAEDSARLTPDGEVDAVRDRRLLAATFHARAGAFDRAAQLLDDVVPRLDPGDARAEALCLRGKVTSDISMQRELLRRALDETAKPSIRVQAYALLVRNHLYSGELASALSAARDADDQAQLTHDRRTIAAATTTRGLMEIWGTGAPDRTVFERARRLAETGADLPADTYSNPRTLLGARALYRYELAEAGHWYTLAAAAAEDAGDVDSVETFLWGLAQLEVRAGRLEAAAEYVERLRRRGDAYDRRPLSLRWIEGVVATFDGREPEARHALGETVARAEAQENWFFVVYGRAALGFLELSLGNAQAAVETFEPVVALPFVLEGDPGQTGALPVAAEAMILAGAAQRAVPVIDHLEQRGRELDHPWCLAVAGRCRGLLLAERRQFDAAFEALHEALSLHERIAAPFDRARTLLALGSAQRRARQRRAARESLQAAAVTFDELGIPLWAANARAELARIGGRAPGPGHLTANERRIAQLVSDGKTNREAAAALFVSERTVESALTQIYRKLSVRSRTELARKLRDDA